MAAPGQVSDVMISSRKVAQGLEVFICRGVWAKQKGSMSLAQPQHLEQQ